MILASRRMETSKGLLGLRTFPGGGKTGPLVCVVCVACGKVSDRENNCCCVMVDLVKQEVQSQMHVQNDG